jgi:hypothetical protein
MHLCVGMSEERGNKLILCGVHISLAPLTLVGGGGGLRTLRGLNISPTGLAPLFGDPMANLGLKVGRSKHAIFIF